MSLLQKIDSVEALKSLEMGQLETLAEEIRERIIQTTSQNGGHIGPNLGVVELTIALHRIFNSPVDKFVFDVSHQCYVHKLLTGRKGADFDNLRKTKGVSGFANREESPHDCFGAGHAGTCLSAALGMASARDLKGTDEHVVAVIGDAALTCGITMEALNNVATSTQRLVIVLNDNEWSIAKNVGAIAKYLNELITNPVYNRLHKDLESFLHTIPGGESIIKFGSKAKKETKDFFVPSSLFEKYGIRYIGPIDGHDIELLHQYMEFCKESTEPIVLHVLTQKGRGYDVAINNPEKFHGTGAFDRETGKTKSSGEQAPAYQEVFGRTLTRYAKENERIVGITAAMPTGTSLSLLKESCPKQFFDVGIAEEHAAIFAAGLATQGMKPVCAIYSTFLQRAFDPIIHDICLQNLPVLFCMERAGLSANDGPTHHGLFDISYLRCVPNAVVMQPKDEDELQDMVKTGLEHNGPAFIRYPRGAGEGVVMKAEPEVLKIGKAEVVREGKHVLIWALGPMVSIAQRMAEKLHKEYGISVCVVNARFVKPMDKETLKEKAQDVSLVVTMEDHVVMGGFGSAVMEALQELDIQVPVERIGWPDKFIEHATSVGDLRTKYGLDEASIFNTIMKRMQSIDALPFSVVNAI